MHLNSNRAADSGDAIFLSATNTGRNTLILNGTTFTNHPRSDIFAEGAAANDVAVVAPDASGGTPVADIRTEGLDGGPWMRQIGEDTALAAAPAGVAGGRQLLTGDDEWLVGALRVRSTATSAAPATLSPRRRRRRTLSGGHDVPSCAPQNAVHAVVVLSHPHCRQPLQGLTVAVCDSAVAAAPPSAMGPQHSYRYQGSSALAEALDPWYHYQCCGYLLLEG